LKVGVPIKTIATFATLHRAHALRVALEGQGIPALVRGEHSLAIIGGGVEVAILQDADADRAHEVLVRFSADLADGAG
jgi:hypothetical protein